jgi:hypothetical protein
MSTLKIALWPTPLFWGCYGAAFHSFAIVNPGKTAGHFQNGGSGLVLILFYSIIYARGYRRERNPRWGDTQHAGDEGRDYRDWVQLAAHALLSRESSG